MVCNTLVGKPTNLEKIEGLERELKDLSIKYDLTELGGFTVMFHEESGTTILYRRNMPIEQTGGMKEFYDKNSTSFCSKYRDIEWPYTGFVEGNILGWKPISIPELVELLEQESPVYTVDKFVREFYRSTVSKLSN